LKNLLYIDTHYAQNIAKKLVLHYLFFHEELFPDRLYTRSVYWNLYITRDIYNLSCTRALIFLISQNYREVQQRKRASFNREFLSTEFLCSQLVESWCTRPRSPNHSLHFFLFHTKKPRESFSGDVDPDAAPVAAWVNPAERETCENVCFWWDISRLFPFNWSSWNVGAYMCSVDRRRYRDGDFNGHWTSQLAPSQCSGTLFPPRFCPPRHSFIPLPHLSPLFSLFLFSPFYSSFYTSFC